MYCSAVYDDIAIHLLRRGKMASRHPTHIHESCYCYFLLSKSKWTTTKMCRGRFYVLRSTTVDGVNAQSIEMIKHLGQMSWYRDS